MCRVLESRQVPPRHVHSQGRCQLRKAPQVPRAFLQHVVAACGLTSELGLRRFVRALLRRPGHSLRLNPRKAHDEILSEIRQMGWVVHPLPWYSHGFLLSDMGQDIGGGVAHLSGEVYSQEPTSMLPAIALAQALRGKDRELVLDLCAAPGSKTTLLAQALGESSQVVANEPDDARRRVLSANVLRAGTTNCLVVGTDGRRFGNLAQECFDAVLVDAPCSAEGNLRRYPDNVRDWTLDSPSYRRELAVLQRQLMDSAWMALKPGGVLVYSTCTLNRAENEEVCDHLLSKGALPLNMAELTGIESKGDVQLPDHLLRVWPQTFDSEGFFLAAFTKDGSPRSSPSRPSSRSVASWRPISRSLLDSLLKACEEVLGFRPPMISSCSPERLVLQEEKQRILLLPKQGISLVPPALQGFVEVPGIPIATRSPSGKLLITDEARLLCGRCPLQPRQQESATEWLQLASNLEANLGSLNSQLDALAEAGDVEGAMAVTSQIRGQRLTPDVVTYTTLMKAAGREGDSPQLVEDIMESAVQEGVRLDAGCFSTALYAFARAGELTRAEACLPIMQETRVFPDLACYNSLIHAASNAGEPQRAQHWLYEAEKSGLPTNQVCYASVLNALAKVADADGAEACMARMRVRRMMPNLTCYNSLMHAFANAALPTQAHACLADLQKSAMQPDVITFNVLIKAYGRSGDFRDSQQVLAEMEQCSVHPTARTYLAIASSYERSGHWEAVEALLAEMASKRMPPNARTHAIRISAYANAEPKRVEEAKQEFLQLPKADRSDGLVKTAVKRCLGQEDAVKLFREADHRNGDLRA